MRVDWLPVPPPGLPHRTRLRLRSHLSQPLRSAHALLLSLGWIVLSFAFWLVWASLLACLLPLTATHLLCVSVVDPVADPSTARPWRLLTPPRLYHLLAHIGSAIGVATVYARAVLSFPMYNSYTLVSLCVSLFSYLPLVLRTSLSVEQWASMCLISAPFAALVYLVRFFRAREHVLNFPSVRVRLNRPHSTVP